MKKQTLNPFYSSSTAILLGSIIIAISILIHGGFIKVGKQIAQVSPQPAQAPAPAAVAGAQTPPAVTLSQVKDAFDKSQIKFGDTNKKLVVVEIADPSCPFCHIAAGKNPQLNAQVGERFKLVSDGGSYVAPVPEFEKLARAGKIAFAYIFYPGHGNGEMGTKAMYCAHEKGKFWEVHDLLMTSSGYDILNNQVKNDKSKSGELATFLQNVFNPSEMKECLESGKFDARIQSDVSLATSLSINGTPGFYLNDKMFGGAYSYKDMEQTVNDNIGG